MTKKPWPRCASLGLPQFAAWPWKPLPLLRIRLTSLNRALGSLMAHRATEAHHPQGIAWGAVGVNHGPSSQDHPWLARRWQVPPPAHWRSLSSALTQREGRTQVLRLCIHEGKLLAPPSCSFLPQLLLPSANPLPYSRRREPLPSGSGA